MNLKDLTPYELENLIEEATALLNKISHSTTIHHDVADMKISVKECPFCGGSHVVKDGHRNGAQRYLCRNCGKTFGSTYHTFFYHSQIDYSTMREFIMCELNELTLKQEAEVTGLSQTTCFSLRHKLYDSIKELKADKCLEGEIELDPFFKSVNMKGTLSAKMPRLSKHRGKSASSRGISSHKVCIFTAVDQNDDIVLEIEGNGPETGEMAHAFSKYISKNATLITDMKQAFQVMEVKKHIEIKSSGHVNEEGDTLSTVNQLHSEFNELYRKYRGVSLRHLQGYLDFFAFRKEMKYRIEKIRDKAENVYQELIKLKEYIPVSGIYKEPLPINLHEVYSNFGAAV